MNVLALNSSPRTGGESKTERLLKPLVQGMQDAGARVDVVELRKKKINDCIGCFTCWTKTPGVCVHKDDMTLELYPKWLESDVVIYATPLYHFTMNAVLKAFIERTLPVLEPWIIQRNGKSTHPLRHPHPAVVVLSVAGFLDDDVFDLLSSHMRFLFREGLLAEIYRPGAESLDMPPLAEKTQDILEALVQAGRELVEQRRVAEATMARIRQPLGDPQAFAAMANVFWRTCIAERVTPREFVQKGLIPRPDSLETFMGLMAMGFQPETAGDLRAALQFIFSGEVTGTCHFVIDNQRIRPMAGPAEKPDLTIESPFEVWMDILTGKADGQERFMAQKYQVKGDFSLLLKMNQLFGK